MKAGTTAAENSKVALTIDELISRYELSNRADGKSPKTVKWYNEMLRLFSVHMKVKQQCHDISGFTIDAVRGYILYLRHKPKFQGHPYTPEQSKPLSAKTLQCHVRAVKATAWHQDEEIAIYAGKAVNEASK